MLLRKHLLGGIITNISQEGLDRIIYIHLNAHNQVGEQVKLCLAVELMGKYSNVVLIGNNGKILGASKIIRGQRNILVGLDYEQQKQEGKLNLLTTELPIGSSIQSIQGLGGKTYTLLKKTLNEDANIILFLKEALLKNKFVRPVMFVTELFPTFFDLGPEKKYYFNSFCELLELFFKNKVLNDLIKQRTSNLRKIVNLTLKKVENRAIVQRAELEKCKGKNEKKLAGDLLLANINNIKPNACKIKVKNLFEEKQPDLTIELNPRLTVSQNAQKYYKKYAKLQIAEQKLTELIQEGKNELEYLQSLLFSLNQVTHESQLQEIQQELLEQGYIKIRTKKKPVENQRILETISLETGNELFIGKNNLQNEYITFKIAKKNDLWFHTQKIPGAHVILHAKINRDFLESEITTAAQIAVNNSHAHHSSLVAVDFTTAKNVRKMPNGKPGMVNYTNFKTIFVNPNSLNEEP
jgi:predicted ribosome quality control (RQC) complex YloA/Tae2 family protein